MTLHEQANVKVNAWVDKKLAPIDSFMNNHNNNFDILPQENVQKPEQREDVEMTVCIAAICDGGKSLVVASDKLMISTICINHTIQPENTQKIFLIKSIGGAVLVSGKESNYMKVVTTSLQEIEAKPGITVEEAVEVFKRKYSEERIKAYEQIFLIPRGLTLESYYNQHKNLNPNFISAIDSNIGSYDFQTDLIISGKDKLENYHIYSLGNPGLETIHDPDGFYSIGYGSPYAMYYLLGVSYSSAWERTKAEEAVKEAKKKAERHSGIGTATDFYSLP